MRDFFAENGYGPDNEAELMYVLANQDAPEGFPSLELEVSQDELSDVVDASPWGWRDSSG